MKVNTIIQFSEHEIVAEDTVKAVKEDLKNQGVKMNTISALDLYVKVEEATVYYVATLKDDTEVKGSVAA